MNNTNYVKNLISTYENISQQQQNNPRQETYDKLIIDTTKNFTENDYRENFFLVERVRTLPSYYQNKYFDWLNCYYEKYPAHIGYICGMMCMKGNGTPKDIVKAKNYMNIACDAKNTTAMYTLGFFYISEPEFNENKETAVKVFKRGTELDCKVCTSFYEFNSQEQQE